MPPSDPFALAAGLARLIRNSGLCDRLGAAARQRYLRRFTTRPIVEAYEELYLEQAARKRM